ncbi:MAG: NAD(P)/FAD-dependent oxidoreductase [Chloroflexi bacterium]|nr:NAD(P)/FAD-dependent oxidoreductase [Chloroflexota bacterium]
MEYDVIVVGAGPAGSTAARECASRGLKVLLLDKSEFPRDKPCGGGVLLRSARQLPFSLDPVVERVIYQARMTRSNGKTVTLTSEDPLCYMTQRRRLDEFLLSQAEEAGAQVRQRTAVRRVEPGNQRVTAAWDGGSATARVLVAADGANGLTARLAGVRADHMLAIALEGNFFPPNGIPREWEVAGAVHSIGNPGGYAWVFPKGDHINVGVCGWVHLGPSLRRQLAGYASWHGFDPARLIGVRGHHIPFRRPGSPLVSGRLLLVGDAAGLADPLTGDGIHSAFVSGKAAATATFEFLTGTATDLRSYERAIETGLQASNRVAMQAHDLVHLGMDQFFWTVASFQPFWRLCCKIARGDRSYVGVKHRLGRLAFLLDLASDVVRVSPTLQRRLRRDIDLPPERYLRTRFAREAARTRLHEETSPSHA